VDEEGVEVHGSSVLNRLTRARFHKESRRLCEKVSCVAPNIEDLLHYRMIRRMSFL